MQETMKDGAVAVLDVPDTWQIDPSHTIVEFGAKHMMITTVKGRFVGVEGKIIGSLASPQDARVDVTLDASSIDSRNEQRDVHLRSADFLDVEHFPTIEFKSTSIEPVADNELKVTGNLSIHGVTRPMELNATIEGKSTSPWGTEVVGISATGKISRNDFGLVWNVALETGGVLVSDLVKISIDLEAIKQ